jgi:hypothetical protein
MAPSEASNHGLISATHDNTSGEARRNAYLHWQWIFLIWFGCASLVVLLVRVFEYQPLEQHGIDFVYFYGIAKLSAADLYSPGAQIATFEKLHASSGDEARYGYSPYPPFVSLALRSLARMPYRAAYRSYQATCAGLYLLGLWVLLRRFFPHRYTAWAIVVPLSVAFEPFVAETWLNGQISIICFVAVCLALSEIEARHYFRSGLALSLCAYKPTLLLLLLPALLFGKQKRVLAGVLSGGLALFVSTTLISGWHIWVAYAKFLPLLGKIEHLRQPEKYVDLVAFLSSVTGSGSWAGTSVVCGLGIMLIVAVIRLHRASAPLSLIWATVIICTLVINVYTPLYDTILLVPGMIASAATLGRRLVYAATPVLFVGSWTTQIVAHSSTFQLMTIAIACLGYLTLIVAMQRYPLTPDAVALRTAPLPDSVAGESEIHELDRER